MPRILPLIITVFLLSACSTRQEGANFKGSTEQRLVTYSIDRMVGQLTPKEIQVIQNKKVFVKSHFVLDNHIVNYADQRLKMQLVDKFSAQLVETRHQAHYQLDMFYTSLGTDRDSTGFSVPIVNLSDPEQSTIVNLLAVDMYHGIAEGNFYLTDLETGKIVRKGKIKSRVKTDSFSTPLFSIPVSNIDD